MLGAKPPSSLQSSLHGAHSKRTVNVPEVGTPFFVHLYSLVSTCSLLSIGLFFHWIIKSMKIRH